jgi:methyl-accepting chemotaxis protein
MKRLVAYLLFFSAISGLVICILGIYAIWRFKTPFTRLLDENLELLATTLSTTRDGLVLADQSLNTAVTSIEALQSTVDTLGKTINDTSPLVDSLSGLLGDELPTTIQSAQTSLVAAQSSAKIIDDVLHVLTSIPFFPGDTYNPPVPLNVALGQVSDSLDTLPGSFTTMQTSLDKTGSNLTVIKANVELISGDIGKVRDSLESSRQVVDQYQKVTTDLSAKLERGRARLPTWIGLAAWFGTIFFGWLATTQIGLFLQGTDVLRRN